ncbi:MAG: hypothetical protein N3A69_04570 [Leptospiraceae bacterium]|nr:hypothetical protein [Leptospiraceae bacterium]
MLEPEGFAEIKKILWKEIEPGMIVLSGLKVNNTVPYELRNYPALSIGQIYELTQKYHLRKDREIVVATCKKGESPQKMSLGFSKLEKRIQKLNEFRKIIQLKKQTLFNSSIEAQNKILDNQFYIDRNSKILNKFNSLDYKKRFSKQKPSLFNNLSQEITIGDVLSKSYKKKFLFPNEFSCNYFLGIAYDNHFKQDSLKYISEGYELLNFLASNVLEKSKIFTFAFSEEISEVSFPLSGREVNAGKICFSSFLKRVMHKKNKETKNFAILCSFQTPVDLTELWKLGEKFSRSQIDLCFLLTENISLSTIQKLSDSFHANFVILKNKQTFSLALIEIFDWYLSEISLQLENVEEVQFQEFSLPNLDSTPKEEPKKEKVVKPFEFKKIKREV